MTKYCGSFKDEVLGMKDSEGLVIFGCGGDLNEWVDGINEILTDEEILLDGTKFGTDFDVVAFMDGELTCLLFLFTDAVRLNMGKFAMWRLMTHDSLYGTWLSDYIDHNTEVAC